MQALRTFARLGPLAKATEEGFMKSILVRFKFRIQRGSASVSALRKHQEEGTPPEKERSTDVNLRSEVVRIPDVNGEDLYFDAVFQDTLPSGSNVGTVVASHGSPGSHKDFKYIVPHLSKNGIRFVAVNFPGFGHTAGHENLKGDHRERSHFMQAIIDKLELRDKLVFLGHSRGSETALKMAAVNRDRAVGVVLANPVGLKLHRAVRPRIIMDLLRKTWYSGRLAQAILRPLLFQYYLKVLKFKVGTADEAVNSFISMASVDLQSQAKYIDRLNESNVKVLLAFGGLDPLVEHNVNKHFASTFSGSTELVCSTTTEADSTVSEEVNNLIQTGERRIAVYFEKEGHFLQKHRAKFIADAIYSMLQKNAETSAECLQT